MATRWTDDQLKAINSTEAATVVSAAAGSGKTAVLVERTIRMLADESKGIEADKLLAVTFTNDSANNMKEKLSQAMSKMLEENPDNLWVAKQQELLSLASVCTIDSFCMELVKNNVEELDVSSSFAMLDDEEHKVLIEKAFYDTAETYYSEKSQSMKILLDNFANEDDRNIITAAKSLFEFKGSLPFPEQWKKKAVGNFSLICDEINRNSLENFFKSLNTFRRIPDFLRKTAPLIGRKKQQDFEAVAVAYDNLSEAFLRENSDFYEVKASALFEEAKSLKIPAMKMLKSDPDEYAPLYEQLLSMSKTAKLFFKEAEKTHYITAGEKEKMISQTTVVFETLWQFVIDAEKLLWEYKLEKNKLYFSDVTRLAISLLAVETENGYEKSELSKRITGEKRYKIILVDEFQDINNLQDVIFKCISDTDDMNVLGKNVFVVGDLKQSIYSFRQSNPAFFLQTREISEDERYKDRCKAVYLRKNFRSRKNILDFTNFVFEAVMSMDLGGVNYDENERLDLGAGFEGENPTTDILLYSEFSDDDNSDDGLNYECKAVAHKVRRMIDDKVQVYENGAFRNCRAGDFCVLLRSGKDLTDAYIKAFDSVGINALADSLKGYLGAREISLALSLLKIIDNPMRDIPLVAVCLSPVLGFTPDEIAKIRLIDRYKRFYQLMLAVCRDESVEKYGFEPVKFDDEAIVRKCENAVAMIKKLRFYASGMSLEKLVRKVYDVTDLMSVAAAFENSMQKRANLRLLVKLAGDYENSTGGGLSDFLRYLANVSESGNDFDEAITVSPGEKTVTIKTIHKSKGLEYPFVIVGNLSKEYYFDFNRSNIILNETYGVGITVRDVERYDKFDCKNDIYKFIAACKEREQKSEELRILYVALTRAKEKLILPLSLKDKAKARISVFIKALEENHGINASMVEGLLSYSEIIFASMLLHPCRDELLKYFELEISPSVPIKNCENVNIELPQLTDNEGMQEKSFEKPKIDLSLFDKICNNLSFEEKEEGSYTLAKMSVTEFVREIEEGSAKKEITYFPPVPEFTSEEKRATAAEKGTDTHLFMELCDFELASQNVDAELERLVVSNKITRNQARNVDSETVRAFFDSEIYQLCRNSESIMREKQFKVRLCDMKLDNTPLSMYNDKQVLVQGIADLIVKTDEGYVIVDYKTDNVKQDSELVDRHFTQLLLYKKAFELVLGEKVTDCYIYSFKLKRPVRIDFENLQKLHKIP